MTTHAAGRNQALGVLVHWSARLLAILLAVLAAGAVAVVVVIPRATHGTALTVLTGSMTPAIPVGSIVVVRPVDPGTLHVGDVATYQRTPGKAEFVTHRVVKIDDSKSPTEFTFQGDANRGPDVAPVTARQIRGRVWFHVPYLGTVRDGLHGRGGLSLVILILAGYTLTQLSGAWRERRRESTRTTLDRPLVLAELSTTETARTRGLMPAEVATQWRAALLDEDAETFRLLIVPPADGLAATLEVLAGFGTRSVTVLPAPVLLTSSASAPAPPPGTHDEPRSPRGADRAEA